MPIIFDFSNYIAERTCDFVGREWVFAEIDRWLADPDGPRCFIITGEPGIGKTAIAAQLTHVRDIAAHHFCIARQADTLDPLLFAQSISQQLSAIDGFAEGILEQDRITVNARQTIRQNLGQPVNVKIDQLIVNASSAATAFTRTVINPLKRLNDEGFDHPLTILVDALDEAAQQPGRETIVDLLASVQGLPSQVRFVLTSRPEGKVLRHFERLDIPHLRLDAGCEENLIDATAYIRQHVEKSSDLRGRLEQEDIRLDSLIERAVDASDGNFLYLVWLMRGLEQGTQPLDALDTLPQGLDGIYREFLSTRKVGRDIERWRARYRPVLGALVVAKAPLSAQQLIHFTELGEQDMHDVLSDLQQFLDAQTATEDRYQFYHQSVVDFLGSEQQAGEYWVSVRESHQRVVDHYRGLASTWEEVNWATADDYGMRYLVEHLYDSRTSADYCQELFALAESRSWTLAKQVNTPWIGSLVSDLHLVSAVDAHTNLNAWIRAMGYQLRRALLESTMSRVSSRAIKFLVKLGDVERALDLARSEKRQWDRFSALRNAARVIAETQPALAVHILEEVGRLLDDRGALEACQARMVAAKEILHLLPAHANVAQALIDETRQLNPQLSDVQQINYLVGYVLPVLTLSEGLDAALQVCEDLPAMARARAFRTIAGELPSDHPSKRLLLEQALALLETLDPIPETLSSAMKCTVDLLAIVREEERPVLLESIEALGENLQAISESRDYAVWQNWAINRVAKIDLNWSKRVAMDSSWRGGTDAFSEIIHQTARTDPQEALHLIDEYLPNHFLAQALLVHIIGIVACEDIDKAEALIETYAQRLKHNQRDVYMALAEGYLAQGDAIKAREIFDTHVVVVDAESIVHATGDLKLAMLERASAFLTLDPAQRYTLPKCRRPGKNWQQKKGSILAFIAAREGDLDYLKSRDLGGDTQAKLTGAYYLAEHAGPKVARDYLSSQHITPHSAIEGVGSVYAHIITAEALQNPDRLSGLLKHFNDPERTHHFCAYMLELPAALEQLVVDEQIEPEEATAIIEPVFTRLLEWECPRGGEPAEDDFFRARCRCYDQCESVLEQLIGVMARLSLDRAKAMVDELSPQPARVYAWLQIVARVQPDRTMIQRITRLAQRYLSDPWQRAKAFYGLAMWLPPAMSGEAKALIALAEPLLSEKPTNYHTNRLGLPVRTGPSRTKLHRFKARALMRLIQSVEQFHYVRESLAAMETHLLLEDKLKPFDDLVYEAKTWSKDEQLALLWKLWELSRSSGLLDVQVFIAASIPILHALGGETAFWDMYDHVEWACEELPLPS